MDAFTAEQQAVLQALGEVYREHHALPGAARGEVREASPRLADALDRLEDTVHEFAGAELVRGIRPEDFGTGKPPTTGTDGDTRDA